jgi:cobalt-zinc-cadmium efflux system outer membrane protein
MRRVHYARLIAAALIFHSAPARADEVVLDLDTVLQRATEVAPEVVAARGRVGEAEALRVGAGVRFTDNPEIEVEAGPRFGNETSADVSVQLGQSFTLGGRRGARRAVAEAEVDHAEAEVDATALDVRLEAALAYFEALYAQRVVEQVKGAEELAQRASDVAKRRRAAGDITDLEVGLATAAAGRAKAAVSAAETDLAEAIGRLAVLIGLAPEDTVTLRGELRPDAAITLADLEPAATKRADLVALEAESEVADAEGRLARANGKPDFGLWIAYEREEDANIIVGGIRLTWPLWDRGQGGVAEARARSSRVAAEIEATRRVASREVRDAFAAYEHARAAVETYETDVNPILDESEELLSKSVDAGTIAISDYLLARQELLAGRRDYLDLLLALAQARVTAQLTAGVSP